MDIDKYSKLVSQGYSHYLELLRELNWFDNSSITEDEMIKRLKIIPHEYMVFALTELEFEADGFGDCNAYPPLIDELLKHIAPAVTWSIACNEQLNSVHITIQGEKSKYVYSIEIRDKWFDNGFIEEFLNNTVLPKEHIAKRFHALPPCDESVCFLFITDKLYHKAIEEGIIPNQMGYFALLD